MATITKLPTQKIEDVSALLIAEEHDTYDLLLYTHRAGKRSLMVIICPTEAEDCYAVCLNGSASAWGLKTWVRHSISLRDFSDLEGEPCETVDATLAVLHAQTIMARGVKIIGDSLEAAPPSSLFLKGAFAVPIAEELRSLFYLWTTGDLDDDDNAFMTAAEPDL